MSVQANVAGQHADITILEAASLLLAALLELKGDSDHENELFFLDSLDINAPMRPWLEFCDADGQ